MQLTKIVQSQCLIVDLPSTKCYVRTPKDFDLGFAGTNVMSVLGYLVLINYKYVYVVADTFGMTMILRM